MHISLLFLCALGSMMFQPAGPDPRAAPSNEDWNKATKPAGFISRTVEVSGVAYPFVIYSPREYHPQGRQRRWPTIIFLHGSGECGTDNQKQLQVGLAGFIKKDPDRWPFLAIFPQKPDRNKPWPEYDAVVLAALEAAKAEYPVDPERVYLTGLSQGGHGAWVIGARYPDLFAALVPICGYSRHAGQGPGFDPSTIAAKLRSIPIWAFHGEQDNVVPASQTREIIEAIKAAKPEHEPRMTIYPDAKHNAWDKAYDDPELPKWLLAQVKATPTR